MVSDTNVLNAEFDVETYRGEYDELFDQFKRKECYPKELFGTLLDLALKAQCPVRSRKTWNFAETVEDGEAALDQASLFARTEEERGKIHAMRHNPTKFSRQTSRINDL